MGKLTVFKPYSDKRGKKKQYDRDTIMRGSGMIRYMSSSPKHLDGVFTFTSDSYAMRAGGIGSLFSSIYSSVVPLIKSALRIGTKVAKSNVGQHVMKSAKKAAMQAGMNVVGDALQGKDVIKSTKTNLKRASTNIGSDIKNFGPKPKKYKPAKKKKKWKGPAVTSTRAGTVMRQGRTTKTSRSKDLFD